MKITKSQLKRIVKEELAGLSEYKQGHLSSDDPQWQSGWSLHDERQAESMWEWQTRGAGARAKESLAALEAAAKEVIRPMGGPEFRSPSGDPKRSLPGPPPVYQFLMWYLLPDQNPRPPGITDETKEEVRLAWIASSKTY